MTEPTEPTPTTAEQRYQDLILKEIQLQSSLDRSRRAKAALARRRKEQGGTA